MTNLEKAFGAWLTQKIWVDRQGHGPVAGRYPPTPTTNRGDGIVGLPANIYVMTQPSNGSARLADATEFLGETHVQFQQIDGRLPAQ